MKRVIIASSNTLSREDIVDLKTLTGDMVYQVYDNGKYDGLDMDTVVDYAYNHVVMVLTEMSEPGEDYSQTLIDAAFNETPMFKSIVRAKAENSYRGYNWKW